ncbi:hypothetical protein B0H12DRAFT_1234877 [Mycena haematopus]|nr:hypothetical protein B0H12DRAFT_1241158 [Mycena haematopus]KAJ7248906.1 hypothetical protein B0H12DRAFT_1234877 [Mycena haematopus]
MQLPSNPHVVGDSQASPSVPPSQGQFLCLMYIPLHTNSPPVAGFYAYVPYPPGMSVSPAPVAAVATQEAPAPAPAPAAPAPVPAVPAPVPAAPAPAAAAPAPAAAAPATAAPAAVNTAGLPPALVLLLRNTGPWVANEVYSVTPTGPLSPVAEDVPAPEWYAVTRGRFVGVVDQYALSQVAIAGVGNSARKAYPSQNSAIRAFNQALTWGGVTVA